MRPQAPLLVAERVSYFPGSVPPFRFSEVDGLLLQACCLELAQEGEGVRCALGLDTVDGVPLHGRWQVCMQLANMMSHFPVPMNVSLPDLPGG